MVICNAVSKNYFSYFPIFLKFKIHIHVALKGTFLWIRATPGGFVISNRNAIANYILFLCENLILIIFVVYWMYQK